MSMAQAQRLAVLSVVEVASGRNLTDVLNTIGQQHPQLSAAEKGALQDMAYGCQRQRGLLHTLLSIMLKGKTEPTIHSLLMVALFQLISTRNAEHAVVNEAVNHAARVASGRYKNLTNAVLRRFLREKDTLLAQAAKKPLAKHNLPDWWVGYLRQHYPHEWHNIVHTFNQHPPLTLRINRRHGDADAYLTELAQTNLYAEKLDDASVRLLQPMPVHLIPGFAQGRVSVQDWGAQQAAYLLDPKPGERILDACAAPGGKTGHLLELADCALTAIDVDAQRLSRVRDNLQRLQLNAHLHVADAQQLNTWYDGEPFDAILADVPCTASGVVRRHPDIKWLRQPDDGVRTASQQVALLDALWHTLKPGGRLLLATCSLFIEENQQQCAALLTRHADAHCRQEHVLLPNRKHDGFYYALIDKA